jgi:hypothetical protein
MSSRALALAAVLGGVALALAAGAQLADWPTQPFALVALAGALLTMIIGGRWPTRSAPIRRDRLVEDESTWWQAMNAGIDPTLDAKRPDPDVHIPSPPDTMGSADQSQQSSWRE